MQTKFMKRTVLCAAGAAAMVLAGAAQAALQNRDLNGDGVTDAFYDTDLNISWLRDGDVAAAVPEPQTYALMLAGLAALTMARRWQRS